MNLNQVLNDGYELYFEHGSRSTKKLNMLHGSLTQDIARRILALDTSVQSHIISDDKVELDGYKVFSKTVNGKGHEKKYSKSIDTQDLDIDFERLASSTEASMEIKFPLSNIRQNRKNNFISALGLSSLMETSTSPITHAYAMFYPINAPYFTSAHKFKSVEQFNVVQAIEEYRRGFDKHPDKMPSMLSLVFFEFVLIDTSSPEAIAKCYENGEVYLRVADVSEHVPDTLPSGLFVNNLDGFLDAFVDVLVNKTPQDVAVESQRRRAWSLVRSFMGADVFDAMPPDEKHTKVAAVIDMLKQCV